VLGLASSIGPRSIASRGGRDDMPIHRDPLADGAPESLAKPRPLCLG
jgi:hypothetical protein